MIYKAQKRHVDINNEMKMLQKSNHYHCVSKAHEKNVSQISGMV